MKPFTIQIFLLLTILLSSYTSGCRSQRSHPASYTGKQLLFGNGGGFTGEATTYLLLENGLLFRVTIDQSTTEENYTPLKKLSGKITQQLFSKADDLQIYQTEFSHPGNIYYFIGIKNKQTTHRITWGDPSYTAPIDAENLYHQLTASLPQ